MVIYNGLNALTIEHMQRKRKSRKGGSYSTLSLLRKELRDGNLQSLFGGSSCIVSSSNAAADPLLSSFILPVADELASSQSHFPTESRSTKKISDETVSRRYVYCSFQFFLLIISFSCNSDYLCARIPVCDVHIVPIYFF